MKKILFISLMFVFFLCGCSKSNKDNIVNNFDKYVNSLDAYKLNGVLSITNNEDTYNYDVEVAFKEKDNYRVSLINKSNGHEQIILKSDNEVYVKTQKSTKQKLNVI